MLYFSNILISIFTRFMVLEPSADENASPLPKRHTDLERKTEYFRAFGFPKSCFLDRLQRQMQTHCPPPLPRYERISTTGCRLTGKDRNLGAVVCACVFSVKSTRFEARQYTKYKYIYNTTPKRSTEAPAWKLL